jgi:hypothetical protein
VAVEPDLTTLGRLWPNREHESNWLKALFCSFGVHRWHTLTLDISAMPSHFDFCRWCPKIKRNPARFASQSKQV